LSVSLVTGASGFIGMHLVRRLRAEGETVWGFVRDRQNDPQMLVVDVTDKPACAEAMSELKPETVYHLAGRRSEPDDEMRRVQVDGTTTVLESVRRSGVETRVVVVGSAAEYGRVSESLQPIVESTPCQPEGSYGITKHEAVLTALAFASQYRMHVVVVRPFNVIGAGLPRGLLIRDLMERLRGLRGQPHAVLRTGRLDTQRDFVDVADVVSVLVLASRLGRPGGIYNACSGIPTPVSEVVNRLVALAGGGIEVREEPSLCRASDVRLAYGSPEKATRELGFSRTVPLDDSIAETWRHFVAEQQA
jgi:GDP-4-dehydro-6-deoxy-D-mannose reductase